MAINKKLVSLGALGVVGLSTVGFAGISSAQTNTTDGPDNLINKIATKFNLNKDDVKKVFDEEHAERDAARQKAFAEKLQKLVDEKKITAEQKTKIEAKFTEIDKEREADKDTMKNLTDTQRKEKMDAKRTELEKWAKDNGIDLSLIRPERGPGSPGGRGHGDKPESNKSTNQ